MPTLPPYKDPKLPQRFLGWLEELREAFRPVPTFRRGAGSPEGVVNGNLADRFYRTDGTVGTLLYVKTTNGGNTGWVAYG